MTPYEVKAVSSHLQNVSRPQLLHNRFITHALSKSVLWAEHCLPNSYVEALTPNVSIFGDRAFKEVLNFLKWDH